MITSLIVLRVLWLAGSALFASTLFRRLIQALPSRETLVHASVLAGIAVIVSVV